MKAINNIKELIIEGNFSDNKIENIIGKQIFIWPYPDKKTDNWSKES